MNNSLEQKKSLRIYYTKYVCFLILSIFSAYCHSNVTDRTTCGERYQGLQVSRLTFFHASTIAKDYHEILHVLHLQIFLVLESFHPIFFFKKDLQTLRRQSVCVTSLCMLYLNEEVSNKLLFEHRSVLKFLRKMK